jgi:hypothetical protein
MTAAVAAPTFSRDDLVLYIQLLLERGGPHGHQITAALGYPSRQVYDALESQARGLRMQSILITEWVPDALDRAAIRALCDVILLHHYEPEFKTMTGRTFADVRRLRDRSVSTIRSLAHGDGEVYVHVGRVLAHFPAARVYSPPSDPLTLIGVADAESWASVVPVSAVPLREEFLATLRVHIGDNEQVEEFGARTHQELARRTTLRADALSTYASVSGSDGP